MKYDIQYRFRETEEILHLPEDGIYYIAYGDDGLRAFRKPTTQEHVVLIACKGSCFIVDGKTGRGLDDQAPCECCGFTLTLLKDTGGMQFKIREHVDRIRTKWHLSTRHMAIAAGALLLFLIIVVLHTHQNSPSQVAELEDEAASMAIEGGSDTDVLQMRLALAQKAFEQGRYDKAQALLEKVLKSAPDNDVALRLREQVDHEQQIRNVRAREDMAFQLWARRVMAEVESLIAAGDITGARFKLLGVLGKSPQYAEALELMQKIEQRQAETARASTQQNENAEAAEARAYRLFLLAKDFAAQGQWRDAYQRLEEAKGLLDECGCHPNFEIDFQELYTGADKRALQEAMDLHAGAQDKLAQAGKAGTVDARAKLYRLAIETAREVGGFYKSVDVSEVEKKAVEGLNELMKPLYVEAITLQKLEGCCYAEGKLRTIADLTHYPEVEYHKMAAEALNGCPCKR